MAASLVSRIATLDCEFIAYVQQFKEQLHALDQRINDLQQPVHGDRFHRQVRQVFKQSQHFCRRFELQSVGEEALLRAAQQFFRQEIGPWFRKSWIVNRAYSKPSGFAGDYEMLNRLYDQATPARGLGGYIDLCILDLPLARAVRGRLVAVKAFLLKEIASRKRPIRILDIASGPCREYSDWPNTQQPVEVVALDNDKEALNYVRQQVVSNLPPNCGLYPERYNALRTRSSSATLRNFGSFDIIYSVGLCDYLTDKQLIGLFASWRETLNEHGALYIAFKDTERYDKTPYQWHLDWFFHQRTESDVLSLYERAGFDIGSIQTSRDSTGIIINFLSRVTSSRILRTEGARSGLPHKAESPRVPHTTLQQSASVADTHVDTELLP